MLQEIDQYLKEENYSSALKKAKKLFNNPQFGEAAYQRAIIACQRLDNRQGTLALFKKVTSVYPSNDFFLQEYAGYTYSLGKFEFALKLYQKLLQRHPDDGVTLANVASCFLALKDVHQAESFVRQALSARKKASNSYDILGAILISKKDIEGAENAFRTALFEFPASVSSAYNYLQFCENHNHLDKFEEAVSKLPMEINQHPVISLQIGILLARQEKTEQALSLIEKVIAERKNIDQMKQKKAFFEYGKLLDIKGRANEAFSAFIEGNQISASMYDQIPKVTQYDLIVLQKEIIMQGEELDVTPIFIVGFPRTGTTLIDQVLSTTNQFQTFEETPVIEELFISQIKKIKSKKTLNRLDLQEQYFKMYKENFAWDGTQVLVDRSAPNITNIHFIRMLFPSAKIVLLHRHPLDVCLSCFMQDFSINALTVEFLKIEKTVQLYTAVMDQLTFLEKDSNLYNLRYEDLISNFDKETQRLFEFLDLEWTDAVRSFHETASQKKVIRTASYQQVTKPLYGTAVGRWKKYQDVFSPYFKTLEPYAEKLGYDFNLD